MKKRFPLIVQYIEKKRDHMRSGKIFYINGEKKEKFLSKLDEYVKDIDNEELFRNNLHSLTDKYSRKMKTWYYVEEGKAFFLSKKFRELDFNSKYRAIIKNQEKKTNREMIVLDYTGDLNWFNSRFVKRTTRNLSNKEKELIRKVKDNEIEIEKDNEKVIMVDYNTYDPYARIFTIDQNRDVIDRELIRKMKLMRMKLGNFDEDVNIQYNQELSKYWKDKLNNIQRIKRVKTHGDDKLLYHAFTVRYKKIPREISDFTKFKGDTSKVDEKELMDYITKHYFSTIICGDVDFKDYPNQKITVYHALDIDCDLMNTFNIHIKDLEPQSFQFIDIHYSTDNNIHKILLEGPIDYDYCKIPCEE